MPTAQVIDLSHHNTVPADFSETKAAGIVGVIHKMTEGTTYVDSKVDSRRFLANEARMLWGIYHYLRASNVKAQVDFFLSSAISQKCIDPNTLLVIDYEEPEIPIDDVVEALQYLEEKTGQRPVLYTGFVLKDKGGAVNHPELLRYPLWLAQYAASPVLPAGYTEYWLWQFTQSGNIPGVDPPTDLNHYQGPVEQLQLEWAGRPVVSPKDPHEPRVVTISIDAPVDVKVEIKMV